MTNGSRVMNSISGRARGTRSRTQKAVGTRMARLTTMVMTPMANEYPRLSQNAGLPTTVV